MIHFDTNYLIDFVTPKPRVEPQVLAWFKTGEKAAISAIAWSEFLNGPVTEMQIRDASLILESRILAFGKEEAKLASKLFNRSGRKRGSQPDCFIAATAICARAPLATQNRKDFQPFITAGLRLA